MSLAVLAQLKKKKKKTCDKIKSMEVIASTKKRTSNGFLRKPLWISYFINDSSEDNASINCNDD